MLKIFKGVTSFYSNNNNKQLNQSDSRWGKIEVKFRFKLSIMIVKTVYYILVSFCRLFFVESPLGQGFMKNFGLIITKYLLISMMRWYKLAEISSALVEILWNPFICFLIVFGKNVCVFHAFI